jgi:signal transduction histidine kinase
LSQEFGLTEGDGEKMSSPLLPTKFLPAERSSAVEVKQANAILTDNPLLTVIPEGVPLLVLVLNANRQIVFANRAVLQLSGVEKTDAVLSLRPGELLHCIHSTESAGGCGTTEFCVTCGAANAILTAQKGRPDVWECRIIAADGGAYDLRVWANPLTVYSQKFTLFSIVDITDENRRRLLERLFFHDILNSLSAVKGCAELIPEATPPEKDQLGDIILKADERAISEIQYQKQMTEAENGELRLSLSTLRTLDILHLLQTLYAVHELARDKQIAVDTRAEDIVFTSDKTLVTRVIGNMVKNALEAIPPDTTVTLGAIRVGDKVRFSVHNPGRIPHEVGMQVFQRSFSTKGKDRGVGTYGMRLLSERYLKGSVSFTSSEENGTTFFATYPLAP